MLFHCWLDDGCLHWFSVGKKSYLNDPERFPRFPFRWPFGGPTQLRLGFFQRNRLEVSDTENCKYQVQAAATACGCTRVAAISWLFKFAVILHLGCQCLHRCLMILSSEAPWQQCFVLAVACQKGICLDNGSRFFSGGCHWPGYHVSLLAVAKQWRDNI